MGNQSFSQGPSGIKDQSLLSSICSIAWQPPCSWLVLYLQAAQSPLHLDGSSSSPTREVFCWHFTACWRVGWCFPPTGRPPLPPPSQPCTSSPGQCRQQPGARPFKSALPTG